MTILYEEIIHYTNSLGSTLFGAILFTILAILCLICLINLWGEEGSFLIFVVLCFSILISVVGFNNYIKEIHHPEGKQTNYWVTLDDSYSVNHLHDEYEIVDIKGDIYVITEKEEG